MAAPPLRENKTRPKTALKSKLPSKIMRRFLKEMPPRLWTISSARFFFFYGRRLQVCFASEHLPRQKSPSSLPLQTSREASQRSRLCSGKARWCDQLAPSALVGLVLTRMPLSREKTCSDLRLPAPGRTDQKECLLMRLWGECREFFLKF